MELGLSLGLTRGGIVGGGAFTPASLSPLMWNDASDASTITEVAGKVSQWDDLSGNNNHVTQINGATQPSTGTALTRLRPPLVAHNNSFLYLRLCMASQMVM